MREDKVMQRLAFERSGVSLRKKRGKARDRRVRGTEERKVAEEPSANGMD